MAEKCEVLIEYLTDSLMFRSPLIKRDPAFMQIEDNLPSIINMSLLSIGKEDVEELTPQEMSFISLKCLHTIYMRLAVASAPEFDVTTEQVAFKKGDRFFHYTSLAENVAAEIDKAGYGSFLEVVDVRLSSRNGTIRNYNLSRTQKTNFKTNSIRPHSIELEWKMFNLSYGDFRKYTLMYSENPIYDEYNSPQIRQGNDIRVFDFYDIKRTKYRLNDLTSGTRYYLVIIFEGRDGGKSIEQLEVLTQ